MLASELDKDPENRFRTELFAAPATIRNFFEVPSGAPSREILHNLPNRGWEQFLLHQLGVGNPREESVGGSHKVRTYALEQWAGRLIELENELTYQTSYIVAHGDAIATAEELRTVVGL